jgi:hypothetical protein
MQHGENGRQSPCSLRICVSKIGWNREISLRTQYINQLDRLLQMAAGATSAHAPSQFGFKKRLTINWKLAIEVKATINFNAWRVVGANCASSKIDLPINLRDKLGVILCVLFDLRGLACTASREAQLDSFELRHLARATNREAQLDLCELRHLARATLESQLDSRELRHLARTALEAQLDLCELRHLECAANR